MRTAPGCDRAGVVEWWGETLMRYGFKATNGRDRKLDIRDGVKRLTVEFCGESVEDFAILARIRRQLSEHLIGEEPAPTSFELTPYHGKGRPGASRKANADS